MANWKKEEPVAVRPDNEPKQDVSLEKRETAGEKQEKPKKPRRRIDFSQLFYNNKFILALSFTVAVLIWFAVSYSNVSNRPRVVYDIPITIEMSDALERSRAAGVFSVPADRQCIRFGEQCDCQPHYRRRY